MQPYADVDGDSGVAGYEIGPGSITVYFKSGGAYLYTDEVTGRSHVDTMKQLAQKGDGLNAYINRHVRERYAQKLQ